MNEQKKWSNSLILLSTQAIWSIGFRRLFERLMDVLAAGEQVDENHAVR